MLIAENRVKNIFRNTFRFNGKLNLPFLNEIVLLLNLKRKFQIY